MNSKVREGEFVKLYFKDIGSLHELSKVDTDVFFYISKELKSSEGNNTVSVSLYMKETIAKKMDINARTVDKSIGVLLKKNLLVRTKYRGMYVVNPKICTKSAFANVVRISMHITYDKNKRSFDVNFKDIDKILEESNPSK